MNLSSRSKNLIGQGMFQIKQKAEEHERTTGEKLLHFEIGDSYFNAPRKVKNKCIKAIKQNKTHYTSSYGLYELREAIAKKYDVDVNNVIITPANFGIFALMSVVCENDICIEYPAFPTYKAAAKFLNLKISKKSNVKILNYPRNPDGKIFSRTLKDDFIIFDNTYNELVYKDYFDVNLNLESSAIINSFSKTHSMSGFRLGYVITKKEIIDKISLLIETTYSCLPEFIQWAGLEALKISLYKNPKIRKRKELMYNVLKQYYDVENPQGGIYMWCKCKDGDKEFKKLLKKGIVCCPGKIFGKKNYIRFCFSRPISDIVKLEKRLK